VFISKKLQEFAFLMDIPNEPIRAPSFQAKAANFARASTIATSALVLIYTDFCYAALIPSLA